MLGSFIGDKIAKQSNSTKTIVFHLDHIYTPKLFLLKYINNTVLFAYSKEYKILIVNDIGEIILDIRKKEAPSFIKTAEKDKIYSHYKYLEKKYSKKAVRDAVVYSKYRPYFNKILTDEKGRIYISKIRPVLSEELEYNFDVFNSFGEFINAVKIEISPDIISNGFIYKIQEDSNSGEYYLQRYLIENYQELNYR